MELWAGAALQGQAEQRCRERLTEARKSTPDDEAATRRALHQGGLLGTRIQWEMNEEKMLWYIPWYIHIYIYIIQYTMIYTNDIYSGMSCITYGI